MLNEFVSVVISGNEEHRKLIETTCLVRRRLPVALIEIPIFNKQGKHIRPNPGDTNRRELRVCEQYVMFLCKCTLCVCVIECGCACVGYVSASVSICVCVCLLCLQVVHIMEIYCILTQTHCILVWYPSKHNCIMSKAKNKLKMNTNISGYEMRWIYLWLCVSLHPCGHSHNNR